MDEKCPMQGQRSSIGPLPEDVFFDNGSISVEPIITTQMPWNSSGTSEQSWIGNTLPFNPNNFQYVQQSRHGEQNLGFSLSESSSNSAQHQMDRSVRTTSDSWNFSSQSVLSFENQLHYNSSNTLLLDNNSNIAELHSNSNQTTTTARRLILPDTISNTLPLDLNASLRSEENGYFQDRRQAYTGASNEQMLFTGTSNTLSPISSECLRASRKRKAIELGVGQSSGEGSSNHFENGGRSQWHSHTDLSHSNITLPRQHGVVIGNGSERASSRLRLGIRDDISSSPLPLSASLNVNSSCNNPHLSVNGLPQQSLQPGNLSRPSVGNVQASSSGSLGQVRNDHGLGFNPPPGIENFRLLGQTFSFPPPVRRNLSPSTWDSASTVRFGSSSMSEECNPAMLEESAARNIPRNSMFAHVPEIQNLNQNPANLSSVGGNATTAARNIVSSRARSIRSVNASETNQPQRTYPQHAQRLSEIVRTSLSPSAGIESGGQGQTSAAPSSSSEVSNLAHRARSALLARRLSSANVTPEHFRRILEIMRRGEALRYEDVMFLEQSFLAMSGMQDRHRDMRMDIDNMSYEELLALEERIGNVSTGLSEEAILKHIKQQKYMDDKAQGQNDAEPCSICREEYNEGEDLGTLECGHDFHRDCIKQWLVQKNLCPICKTTGLNI